jgi:drug/metabolite transporter (DMT)-like permease
MIEEQQKTNNERYRTLASSFAYVNPIVALLLSYAIADEPISRLGLAGVVIILIGVMFITLGQTTST